MPNDLSVTRLAAPAPGVATPHATPSPPPPGEAAASAPGFPNPTLRLDAALGMVVIEFRDTSGSVKSSIPTQQQLDAYRAAERTHSSVAGETLAKSTPSAGPPAIGAPSPTPSAPAGTAATPVPSTTPAGVGQSAGNAPPINPPPPTGSTVPVARTEDTVAAAPPPAGTTRQA